MATRACFIRSCHSVITTRALPRLRLRKLPPTKKHNGTDTNTDGILCTVAKRFRTTLAAQSLLFEARKKNITKRRLSTISTADGMRIFFEWLEKRYGARFGGIPPPMDGNETVVVTRDSLELQDLQKLFHHEISILKIREFFPKEASSSLGRELAFEGQQKAQNWKVSTQKGLESSDVTTVGRHSPYNIALSNHATDEYFGAVRKELRDRRGLLDPKGGHDNTNDDNNTSKAQQKHEHDGENTHHLTLKKQQQQPKLWPMDLLRLELDELWPSGAGLARANHEPHNELCMGGGIPRLMVGPTRWKKGLVHVDELAPLSDAKGCFSANIYLQLPHSYSSVDTEFNSKANSDNNTNGEAREQPVMELWPLGIRSKWDWYRNAPTLSNLVSQDPEGQVILRKVLGDEHKQTISAAPGDLILLCVQRPHCAIGFGHGDDESSTLQTRVSLQCFLQYNGGDERLTIES